jgi:hypothetical protein
LRLNLLFFLAFFPLPDVSAMPIPSVSAVRAIARIQPVIARQPVRWPDAPTQSHPNGLSDAVRHKRIATATLPRGGFAIYVPPWDTA